VPVNRKDHDALRQELGIGNWESSVYPVMPRSGRVSGFRLRASGNTCLFGLFGLFRHCEEQSDEAIQLLRSGIRVSGTGCNINKNGHREGEARGDLRYPSFLFLKPELENQNLRRRLPHHGSFATEVICDSWFVVCVGY